MQVAKHEVMDRVRALVCDQLGVEQGELVPDSNILDDLGADSLDVVELVMALEESFDVEIPDEEIDTLRTLGDVEKYVASRLAL